MILKPQGSSVAMIFRAIPTYKSQWLCVLLLREIVADPTAPNYFKMPRWQNSASLRFSSILDPLISPIKAEDDFCRVQILVRNPRLTSGTLSRNPTKPFTVDRASKP